MSLIVPLVNVMYVFDDPQHCHPRSQQVAAIAAMRNKQCSRLLPFKITKELSRAETTVLLIRSTDAELVAAFCRRMLLVTTEDWFSVDEPMMEWSIQRVASTGAYEEESVKHHRPSIKKLNASSTQEKETKSALNNLEKSTEFVPTMAE